MPRTAVLILLILAATTVQATTIHVPADRPTIQAGVDAATNGDTVLVADGTTLAQQERQESGRDLQATDLGQLIEAMNTARRNNRLYVQLRRQDAGAVMSGRRMASLPPSVLDVLGADLSEGRKLFQQRIDPKVCEERDYLCEELLRVARERGAA